MKALTQYSFLALTHFLMDIIPVVTRLNLKFQSEDLDITRVGPNIRLTMHELDVMMDAGCSLKNFTEELSKNDNGRCTFKDIVITKNSQQETQFNIASKEFVSKLKENLEARFPTETLSLATAAEILAMRGISFISTRDLAQHGNKELEVLLDHFGKTKQIVVDGVDKEVGPIIDTETAKEEWKLAKQIVRDHRSVYGNENLKGLWQVLRAAHGSELPNLLKIVKLALLFPMQTATCERGFSIQNNTKTIKRNRLGEKNIQRLLNIHINGPNIRDFDFVSVLKIWRASKERRLFHAAK